MEKKEEVNNSPLEVKMGFLDRYKWKGAIVLVLSLLAPYMGTMIDQYIQNTQIKAIRVAIKEEVAPVGRLIIKQGTKIDILEKHIRDMETLMINCKGGAKALLAKDIDYIARKAVGMQSIVKVKEVKAIILKYPRNTEKQKTRLRKRIKQILIRNSKIYIKDLNSYQHRAIGRVGDYIWSTFPMEEFLSIICELTVDSPKDNKIIVMTDDVMMYMMEAQNTFFMKMMTEMRKAE